ncbi:MAG: AI-2E family transporter [Candidatus Pacebacteria bacterium]|nr:AI-2E family transporter [Candidatus Paceibacterota bacterium]
MHKHSHKFLIVLLIIFTLLFISVFIQFLAPLVIGALLAGIFTPLNNFISKKFKEGSNIPSLISTVLVALIIILPFITILSLLFQETQGFLEKIKTADFYENDKAIQYVANKLNVGTEDLFSSQILPTVKNVGEFITKNIATFLSNAANLIINFFLLLLTIFYMLKDGKKLSKFLIEASPLEKSEEMNLYKTFKESGRAVLYGNLITAGIQGFLGGLGFLMFGISSPVLWGFVMAFFAFIPMLGPYLVFVPAAIYMFLNGNIWVAIAFMAYNIVIVSSVDNVLKPKLIGDKMKIHPLFILISVLGGIKIFGIIGLVYGPLIASIFISLIKNYIDLSKKS